MQYEHTTQLSRFIFGLLSEDLGNLREGEQGEPVR